MTHNACVALVDELQARITELEQTLREYLVALSRKHLAVRDERNQAEEDATLDVEMYEKRLRKLVYP